MAKKTPVSEKNSGSTLDIQGDARRQAYPESLSSRNLPWGGIAIAVTIAIVASVIILGALWLFARTLALLALSVAIAASLAPLVGWLEKRVPRTLAILLVYLAILVFFIIIGWIVIPPIIPQSQEIADLAPELVSDIESLYDQYVPAGEIPGMERLVEQVGQVFSRLVSVPLGFASGLIDLVLVLFVSLYTLIEAPRMRNFALSLFPEERRERVDYVLNSMAQAMGGFIRGAVITAIIIGVLTSIGLTIIGMPYALVLGLVAGVLELLPYVGPIIASVPILIVALLQSPTQALIVLIFIVLVQQLEGNVLTPNIMKTQTEVSPLLTIIAIVAGASLGGILGALVAIPIAAALRVFVREVAAPMVRRQVGATAHIENES